MKSKTARRLRGIYLLILFAVIVWLVWNRRSSLSTLFGSARPWMIVAAVLLSFGMVGWSSVFWTASLRSLGQDVTTKSVLMAGTRSLFARYIPGSVWYAAGRIALLRSDGVGATALAVTAALEIITSIIVAFTLGLTLVAATGTIPGGMWWAVPVVGLVGLVLSRPALNRLLGWVGRRWGGGQMTIPKTLFPMLLGWMAVYWIWASITFTVYLFAFPERASSPIGVAGAFMLAWGVGFLAIVAPQGLGVFEATLAALLGTGVDGAIVAAGYRGVILVRDALATVTAEFIAKPPGGVRRGSSRRDGPPDV